MKLYSARSKTAASSLIVILFFAFTLGCSSGTKKTSTRETDPRFQTPKGQKKPTPSNIPQSSGEPSSATSAPEYQQLQQLYSRHQFDALINQATVFEGKNKTSPLLPYIRNLKGLAYIATKRPLPAIVQFQRALDSADAPEVIKPYLHFNLASALADADQVEDSLQTLKEINPERLNNDTRAKYFSLKAKNLIQKSEWFESAKATLEASRTLGETAGTRPALVEQLDRALSQIQKQQDLSLLLQSYGDAPLASQLRSRVQPSLDLNAPPASSQGDSRSVGVLLPLSGKFSVFGSRVLQAITQAFRSFDPNAEKFRLHIEDSGDTAESAIRGLNKLANQRNVSVVIGPLLSKGIDQVATRAEMLGLPLVTLSQQSAAKGEYVISAGLTPKLQAMEIARVAIEKFKLKRFAIVFPRDRFGEQYSQSFWDAIESMGGQIVGYESYAPGETDFRAAIDKLSGTYYTDSRKREIEELAKKREELKITKRTRKTAMYFDLPPIVNFEAVFIPDDPKTVAQIVPMFAYRDIDKIRFLGISTWHSQELLDRAKEFIEGALFVDGLAPESESKMTAEFVERFSQEAGEMPTTIDAMAHDAALAVKSSLGEIQPGLVDRSRVRDHLRATNGLNGATGKISYQDGELVRTLSTLTIQSGKFSAVK